MSLESGVFMSKNLSFSMFENRIFAQKSIPGWFLSHSQRVKEIQKVRIKSKSVPLCKTIYLLPPRNSSTTSVCRSPKWPKVSDSNILSISCVSSSCAPAWPRRSIGMRDKGLAKPVVTRSLLSPLWIPHFHSLCRWHVSHLSIDMIVVWHIFQNII